MDRFAGQQRSLPKASPAQTLPQSGRPAPLLGQCARCAAARRYVQQPGGLVPPMPVLHALGQPTPGRRAWKGAANILEGVGVRSISEGNGAEIALS